MIAFIDLETGGFSSSKNGLCEMAVIITNENLDIIQSYATLIKPYYRECGVELVSYKPDAMAVHNIPLERLEAEGVDVEFAFKTMWMLLDAHKVTTVAGHNIRRFDIPWLEYLSLRFVKRSIKCLEIIDTLDEAKLTINSTSYTLKALCEIYSILNENAHGAESDAITCVKLLKRLRE